MQDLRILLSKAAEAIQKNMALIQRDETLVYPEGCDFGITFDEACKKAGKNYKGYNIYMSDSDGVRFFICVEADKYYESEAIKLVILLLSPAVNNEDAAVVYMRKAIEGKYDAAELAKLEEDLRAFLPGYLLLVDDFGDARDEVSEILVNTMNVKLSIEHDNRIIALIDDENVPEACSSFIKNVLSELLIECKAVIGGKAVSAKEFHGLYENCNEVLCLKQIFGIGSSFMDYESMYGYRVAHSLDPKLKELICSRVFTEEFREMVNGELGITIEEFFKNNLNLTDTAAKLYIHRNTLLYRLDKINKCTGFDLKKFEDSWLFKLAWMIYKEI